MAHVFKAAVLVVALLIGNAAGSATAQSDQSAAIVEFESPLASRPPLQGYLRQSNRPGPSPAVVLLHACNGNWKRLDERWGKRIASWGYVTLTVDSFGPRGLQNTCNSGAPVDLAYDAYRALSFLAQEPSVDPSRVAAVGFAQGGWLALTSVERGAIERTAQNKFHAAIAFYPPCLAFKGNMTVPTLVLIGELDDWTPAVECRNMAADLDDYGISRQQDQGVPNGVPINLVIYPGAYHSFDVPRPGMPAQYLGHRLEYDRPSTDRSVDAVREFLGATIGGKEQIR